MDKNLPNIIVKPHSNIMNDNFCDNNIVPIKHNLPVQLPPQREKTVINKKTSESILVNVKIKKENNNELNTKETQTDCVKIILKEEYEKLMNFVHRTQEEKNKTKINRNNNSIIIYVPDDEEEVTENKIADKTKFGENKSIVTKDKYTEIYSNSEKLKKLCLLGYSYFTAQINQDDFLKAIVSIPISNKNSLQTTNNDENLSTEETPQDFSLVKSNTELEPYPHINNEIKIQHDLDKLHHNILQPSKDISSNNNDTIILQDMPLLKNVSDSEAYSNINYQFKVQQERHKLQQYSLQNSCSLSNNDNLLTHDNEWAKKITETETYPNINYQSLQELQRYQHQTLQQPTNISLNNNDTHIIQDNSWHKNNTEMETISNVNRMKMHQGLQKLQQGPIEGEMLRNKDEQKPNNYLNMQQNTNNSILRADNHYVHEEQQNRSYIASPLNQRKDKCKLKAQAQYTQTTSLRNKGHRIFQRPDQLHHEFQQQPNTPYFSYNYANRQQMYPIQHQQHQQQQNRPYQHYLPQYFQQQHQYQPTQQQQPTQPQLQQTQHLQQQPTQIQQKQLQVHQHQLQQQPQDSYYYYN